MDELARIAEGLARIENPRGLLEGLFAYAPVGFQIYNANGQSILVNQAFLQLFGSAPPPDYSIFKDEIAERNGFSPLVRRAFAGETFQLPVIWYDPRELKHVEVLEGRRVAIEISVFPLKDAAGKVPFVALFHKDVTERETLGEALRQSQKLEAVGRLAGGVAHDFNNLLTLMQGYLDFLQDVDQPHRSTVQEIARAADPAAPRVQPPPDAAAPGRRPQRRGHRARKIPPAPDRRAYRAQVPARAGPRAHPRRPRPARTSAGQPLRECARRHAAGRPAADRDEELRRPERGCPAASGREARRLRPA